LVSGVFNAEFERDGENRLRLKGRLRQDAVGPWRFRTVSGFANRAGLAAMTDRNGNTVTDLRLRRLAAINNRTLAAYGLAGVRPANVIMHQFDTLSGDVQARFYEPGVPNFTIPVTRGKQVLFYVDAPR